MSRVSLADAKAHLSALVDRAAAGESVDILRRGKPAARLVPPATPKRPIDGTALAALTAKLPRQRKGAAKSVRALRDSDRY